MDEMKDPITLDFTATQAPAEDAPVGQKALDSERPPVRVVLLALDQGKFDSQPPFWGRAKWRKRAWYA